MPVAIATIVAWVMMQQGPNQEQPLTETQEKALAVQDKSQSKGNADAPVKMVEYADILCPYCAKAHTEILPQIESNYIDKGKVHLEVRLAAMITRDSQRAAEGAYCAADQGMYWNYLDKAYEETWNNYYSQNKSPEDVDIFSSSNIGSFATRVGVDTMQWQQCMDEGTYVDTIEENRKTMSELEAYGTPFFLINGNSYRGAPPFSTFKAVIDSELDKLEAAE